MHVLDLIGIGLSVSAASADGYRQFSAFAPWTVVNKRRDLFCGCESI
jgi:hypothetical protein